MRWVLGSSLRLWRLVLALAIGLMVFGFTQLRSEPVDVYPEFMPPSVEVQTEALGLSAVEVEQLITVPLEQDLLNGVPWLGHIHSASMPGLSVIDLTFQQGTNLYAARQMVQERMTQAHALPNVGSPPIMIQPLASASRVAMIGLSSREVSYLDMSVLARWKIRPRLMGVPGVANVSIYGQRDRQLQVRVDPQLLRAKGVSLTQVIETAGNALWVSPLTFVEASTPGTGGFVESPNQRLPIQHISPISTPHQLAQVPVEGARSLRLGNVTTVIEDHQPLIGDAVAAGASRGSHTLFLVIDKFPSANNREVTKGIEDALAEMAPGLHGITIDPGVYRPATYLQNALRNVGMAAVIALALLLAGLFFVLASWRAALVALIVIPVSLTAAALVLYLSGATFTGITLLGLAAATGLVIDDVITDIDAVSRRLAGRGGQPEPARDTILAAFMAARRPLMSATLAILLATLPFLFLGTLANAFSRPLVFTFALTVLSSVLVAFTLTPVLAFLLLRGRPARREGPLAVFVHRLFDRRLAAWIGRPRKALAVAGVLTVAALAVVPQVGGRSLLPALQDRNLLLQVQAVPGIALPEMDRITAAVSGELRRLPGVTRVGAHVGRAISSDQFVGVNSAEVWITLAGSADYTRSRAAIETVVHGYPGLKANLVAYPTERVAQLASGSTDDLLVRVYGADLTTLQRKAQDVRAMLAHVPGVANPVVRPVPVLPAVDIRVKLPAALKYGLRPGDVRRDATTLTSGLIVGNLYEQSKVFDVVVWGAAHDRGDLTELGNQLIGTPSGRFVPLKTVATLTVRPEPSAVTHDDVLRDVEVAAKVTGNPGSVVAAVRSRLAAMPMPYEYHAEVFGNAAVKRADLTRALAYGAVTLIGIFLLLQTAVASWRRAGLLLLSLPLSVVGGVLVAPLAGGMWSVPALAGLFAVFALAVRAAVQLGHRAHAIEQTGVATGRGAVLAATRDRVVPLWQSALLTAAVVAPAAVWGSRAGLEFLHPLAVTMLGGLVSLLLVQAFVLPAFLTATAGQTSAPDAPPDVAPAPEPQHTA
jgi:Cu/Ag efflux pump CusA